MKRVLMIFFALSLIMMVNCVSAISNPSAVYCEDLGYNYEINNTENGNIGICIISQSVKLDAWDFFEGKIGQQYSYCAKEGYSSQTVNDGKNSFSEEYAACIIDSSVNKGLIRINIRTNKSVTDLMNFSEKLNSSTLHSDKKAPSKFVSIFYMFISLIRNSVNFLTGNAIGSFTAKLPENFDWRDYNGNWLTPVKNQGSCGSCWAFATVGDVESKIKIARNDSNFDVDLSEQDLVSCGVPYGFYPGSGGCEGATLEDPLNYLNSSGVTDEACFSYTASDESCSDKCSSANKRLWKIDNYGYVPLTGQDMKDYLVTKGPIIAGIYMAGNFVDGIYTCKNPGSNLNHAVVIVGYNDTGNYWIVKNSWGSNWNGDGYFKVGYGKCNIEMYPMFIDIEFNSTQKINTNNVSVYSGVVEGNYSNFYEKDNLFVDYKCNDSNCSYDIQNAFQPDLSKVLSLDAITYQNSSDGKTSLNYLNNNSWESLGFISQTPYLVKYNLCNSLLECSNVISDRNVFLRYFSQNSTSIDLLYLEAGVSCFDNWTLNDNWSSCDANDTQYKNYYDLNECYQNISYMNRTESQYCDYCIPNWTENQICNSDNSSTTWYNDSNSCFGKTGLSSDLTEMPENQTLSNSCSYNNTIIENASFCGDAVCDSDEDCSSCSLDCGVCPAPAPISSSGGGGSSGGSINPITTSEESKPIVNNTNSSEPIPNKSVNESVTLKEKKQQFSLTGLMVSVQNNQSLRIVFGLVVLFGTITVLMLIKKQKFSKKQIHRNMVKIHKKKK